MPFRGGHVTVISEDQSARGGHVLACADPRCRLRAQGTEMELVRVSADHYDETVTRDE